MSQQNLDLEFETTSKPQKGLLKILNPPCTIVKHSTSEERIEYLASVYNSFEVKQMTKTNIDFLKCTEEEISLLCREFKIAQPQLKTYNI